MACGNQCSPSKVWIVELLSDATTLEGSALKIDCIGLYPKNAAKSD